MKRDFTTIILEQFVDEREKEERERGMEGKDCR